MINLGTAALLLKFMSQCHSQQSHAATDMATRTDASRRLGRLHGHLAAGTPTATAAGGGELYHSEHADDRDVFYLWPPGQVPGALPDDRGEDYLPQHAPLIAAGTLAASKRYNFERWGDSHLWRGADRPAVRVFRPDPSLQTGSAVIIAPGGGFVNLPPHEGDQIAEWLAAHGVTAFLLRYRLVSSGYPLFTQLRDMQRAIRLVRFHAARWMLDKTRIGVLGVSGGGHVATGTSVWYDLPDPTLDPADPIDAVSARPDACVLAYPLTDPASFGGFTNPDTKEQVWGAGDMNPGDWATGKFVTPATPPTFIGHSTGDTGVTAVDHSDPYFAALQANGVDAQYERVDFGGHGCGLVGGWGEVAMEWMVEHQYACAQPSYEYEWADADEWNAVLPP